METPHVRLEKILEEARFAPSGDNIQPWIFREQADGRVSLYKNQPENIAESMYFAAGTFVGLGCILENIVIVAQHFGFVCTVKLNEEAADDQDLIADIFLAPQVFSQEERLENEKLFQELRKRHTDRRLYTKRPVDDSLKRQLHNLVERLGGRLYFVEGEKRLAYFSDAATAHDEYFWKNPELRDSLLKSIHFNGKNPQGSDGMPLATLNLGWMGAFFKTTCRLAYHIEWLWGIIAWRAKRATRQAILHSGALVFITLPKPLSSEARPGSEMQKYVEGGRIVQRLWLQAGIAGLSVQPQFSFVGMIANEGNEKLGAEFLEANARLLTFLRSEFLWLDTETLVFAMRVGYPSSRDVAAYAPKKEVSQILWRV